MHMCGNGYDIRLLADYKSVIKNEMCDLFDVHFYLIKTKFNGDGD